MSKDENPSKRGINIKFIKELRLVSSFFIFNKLKNIIGRKKYIIFLFDIKNAKENGYVPASEFISLVRTVEGESSLNEFLASEPTVLKTNEEELFVVLTKGTFSYSAQTDEFIFKREIEYENLEKAFESNTVYKLKSQLNEPHKLIRDVYDSGEVSERLKMYESSNTPTDQIEIQKWESIKNSYETGFYETDAEKDERINIEKEEIENQGKPAILITAPKIRPWLSRVVSMRMQNFTVLSYTEIPEDQDIAVVSKITTTPTATGNAT